MTTLQWTNLALRLQLAHQPWHPGIGGLAAASRTPVCTENCRSGLAIWWLFRGGRDTSRRPSHAYQRPDESACGWGFNFGVSIGERASFQPRLQPAGGGARCHVPHLTDTRCATVANGGGVTAAAPDGEGKRCRETLKPALRATLENDPPGEHEEALLPS